MDKKEKEKLLRHRLINLRNCLEVSQCCLNFALINLESLDEFNDLVHNWDKYKDIVNNDSEFIIQGWVSTHRQKGHKRHKGNDDKM